MSGYDCWAGCGIVSGEAYHTLRCPNRLKEYIKHGSMRTYPVGANRMDRHTVKPQSQTGYKVDRGGLGCVEGCSATGWGDNHVEGCPLYVKRRYGKGRADPPPIDEAILQEAYQEITLSIEEAEAKKRNPCKCRESRKPGQRHYDWCRFYGKKISKNGNAVPIPENGITIPDLWEQMDEEQKEEMMGLVSKHLEDEAMAGMANHAASMQAEADGITLTTKEKWIAVGDGKGRGKIAAIKAVRERVRAGLKPCKMAVDKFLQASYEAPELP